MCVCVCKVIYMSKKRVESAKIQGKVYIPKKKKIFWFTPLRI